MNARRAVTIARSSEEVYRYWRDLENLPTFMHRLEAVHVTGETTSHWVAKSPTSTVEWDAEITDDEPGERIAWRSVNGDVANSGSVAFRRAPGERGTEVHVELVYDAPGGKAGSTFAKIFGEEPGQQIGDDLQRFKQIMELGEIVRSSGAPEGVGQGIPSQQPSRPSARAS